MAGVRELYRKYERLRDGLRGIAEDSVQETSGEFMDLNKDQMQHGLDSKGDSLGEYKNAEYKAKKLALNPLAQGRKDYKLTGAYYRGMFAIVDNGVIKTGSFDEKAPFLQPKPDERFGLDPEHQLQYIGILRPVLHKNILNKLITS